MYFAIQITITVTNKIEYDDSLTYKILGNNLDFSITYN